MVLENLGSKLREGLNKVAKSIFVDKKVINELVQNLQRALLDGDVDVQLVFDLTERIKERALNEKAKEGISQREHIIKIVYEELTDFLGKEKSEIKIGRKKPFKIMLEGLYGVGKTSSIGKLANYYKKRGYKVATLGLDTHRAAAMEQIEQVSKQVMVKCFSSKKEKDPVKIYKQFESEYKNYDILIVDTAGRDALSEELIRELEILNKLIKPDENLLVIPAEIGQVAKSQAEQFHKSCNVTGIMVTKLDGTAKAGGALTGCAVTGAKIKFVGTGEKINDLELFNPEGFVSRLLGMGDLEALLEKTRGVIDEKKAEDLGKKMLKGEFNLIDLYEQMEAMSKMGPISKIVEMVPGFSQLKLPKDLLKVQEGKLRHWRVAMDSMTKEELERPDEIVDVNRINRISKGSGVPASEVRELLKQYRQAKKLMKVMKGKSPEKLMRKFKGRIPGF